MKKLTINEQIFLIAIWHLGTEAYGVKIREKIKEITGSSMLFGTLYNSLENLVKKGYASTRKGEATAHRGGNNKIYYDITDEGRRSLEEARELQQNLWQDMPATLLKEDRV